VIGNHDNGLAEVFGSLMNAQISEYYSWQFKQEKYLAIHGHQFDLFFIKNVFLSKLAAAGYITIQKIDFKDKRMSHFVKSKSKGWLRMSEKVAHGAMLFAKKQGATHVFCGHTHKAMQKINGSVKYYNCGCWTDVPCTYITIDEKDIKIRDF
jgi:UDP-2,3-diacylglucosamine pyrophosphatase LpxH